jgi:O-antigen/teichoic acid export membrane protein
MFKSNRISIRNNAIFSIVDTAFLPLMFVALTPIFISELGLVTYGLWALINSLSILLTISGFGCSETVIRYFSVLRGNSDLGSEKKFSEIFSTFFYFQLLIVIVLAIVFYVLFLVNYSFVKYSIPTLSIYDSNLTLLSVHLLISVRIIEVFNLSFFKGLERFDISSVFSILSKAISMACQVVAIMYSDSFYNIFLFQALFLGSIVIVQLGYIYKSNSEALSIRSFNLSTLKAYMPYSFWSWASSSFNLVSSQLDRILVAHFLKLEALAIYSVAILVFSNLHAILAASVSWIFPRVATLTTLKETNLLYKRSQLCLTLAALLIVMLFWLLIDFVPLIFGGLGNHDNSIFVCAMVSILPIYALTITPHLYLKGLGLVSDNFKADVASFFTRLFILPLALGSLGLYGAWLSVFLSGSVIYIISTYYLRLGLVRSVDNFLVFK